MSTVFLVCVVLGTTVLVAQTLLTAIGLGGHGADMGGHDVHDVGHSGLVEGLDLLSVRALSAAVAVYGAIGLGLSQVAAAWLAGIAALVPALLTAAGTAYLTRQMLRLESSGSLQTEGAIGQEGRVYLTVPAGSVTSARHGLVHVAIQGRTVELRAVTREGRDLPTGASVVVIAVGEDGETVEVVPPSTFEGLIDGHGR